MTVRFGCFGAVAALAATLAPLPAAAETPCSGHQLLEQPRPETSCQTLAPEIFISPDKTLHALVLPVDVSLYATPDMESRVVIRSSDGNTLNSEDHSSPRGEQGYHVYSAKWSPDAGFFVYSLTSAAGHQPWSFPIMVYSRSRKAFAKFNDMIGGEPTLSGDFDFSGPHALTAKTWKKQGDIENPVPDTVDLEKALAKLKPAEQ